MEQFSTFHTLHPIGEMMRRKVVVHIHGGGFKEYYASNPEFVRKYLLMANCVIALSESWREFFVSKVGLSNVQIVHNIVPPPQKKVSKLMVCYMVCF